jgi:DNA mismatch repair protein MutL
MPEAEKPTHAHRGIDHQASSLREPPVRYQTRFDAPAAKARDSRPPDKAPSRDEAEDSLTDFLVLGEAMSTYIIVENQGRLMLIDKHAAHERIIFDRLKSGKTEIMSQTLMIPVTLTPEAEVYELLMQNAGLLSELGFTSNPTARGPSSSGAFLRKWTGKMRPRRLRKSSTSLKR